MLANSEQFSYRMRKQNSNEACICPEEGHCSKPGGGLFASGGDAPLTWGGWSQILCILEEGSAGAGAGEARGRMEKWEGEQEMFNVTQVDLELYRKLSGEDMFMPMLVWYWGSFDFWRVQSTGSSSKALGWGCANDVHLLAYSKVYAQSFPEGVLLNLGAEQVLLWVASNLFTHVKKVRFEKIKQPFMTDMSLQYLIICNHGCSKRTSELQVCVLESAPH